jgi:hypothetical protein
LDEILKFNDSLERFDSGMSQQVDFQIRFGLEEFAALVADASARSALSVNFAQMTSQSGSCGKDGRTSFARMMGTSTAAGQTSADVGAVIYRRGRCRAGGKRKKKKSHLVRACVWRPFY